MIQIQNEKKNWIVFLILYWVSRGFSLFNPGFAVDLTEYSVWAHSILSLQNPYSVFQPDPSGFAMLKYPPLFYIQIAVIFALFGYSCASIKFGFILYEFGTILILRKFTLLILTQRTKNLSTSFQLTDLVPNQKEKSNQSSGKTFIPMYVYAFSPIMIYTVFFGAPFQMAIFFSLTGLFLYFKGNHKLAAVLFCLGFLTELYPIFCLVFILLNELAKKEWKKIISVSGTFVITLFLLIIPFLITEPESFLLSFLIHFSRIPQVGVTLWTLIRLIGLPWDIISFSIINISPIGLTFIIFFTISIIFTFLYMKRKKGVSQKEVVAMILIFFTFLPLIFLTILFRYFVWIFPISCLFIKNTVSFERVKKIGIISAIICVLNGIFYLIFFPTSAYENLYEYYLTNPGAWEVNSFFVPTTITIMILVVIWFILERSNDLTKLTKSRLSFFQSLTIIIGLGAISICLGFLFPVLEFTGSEVIFLLMIIVIAIINIIGIILSIILPVSLLENYHAIKREIKNPNAVLSDS